MGKLTKDARWHQGGESRLMAEANGWCMVRRPGRMPYVVEARVWHSLPTAEDGRKLFEEYHRKALEASDA